MNGNRRLDQGLHGSVCVRWPPRRAATNSDSKRSQQDRSEPHCAVYQEGWWSTLTRPLSGHVQIAGRCCRVQLGDACVYLFSVRDDREDFSLIADCGCGLRCCGSCHDHQARVDSCSLSRWICPSRRAKQQKPCDDTTRLQNDRMTQRTHGTSPPIAKVQILADGLPHRASFLPTRSPPLERCSGFTRVDGIGGQQRL